MRLLLAVHDHGSTLLVDHFGSSQVDETADIVRRLRQLASVNCVDLLTTIRFHVEAMLRDLCSPVSLSDLDPNDHRHFGGLPIEDVDPVQRAVAAAIDRLGDLHDLEKLKASEKRTVAQVKHLASLAGHVADLRTLMDSVSLVDLNDDEYANGEFVFGKASVRSTDGSDLNEDNDLAPDDYPTRSHLTANDSSPRGAIDQTDDPQSLVVVSRLPNWHGEDLRTRLKPFRENLLDQALPLVPTPDLRPVREKLHYALPHLTEVADRILGMIARSDTVRIPPIVLLGPPGCGKTTLLEELAALLDVPDLTVDGAGVADGMLLGTDARWSTGAPGVHLDLIEAHRVANPIIILDELEKLGGSERNGDIRQRLLGLLEPRRAKAFLDPFLTVPIDMSAVSFVFTANLMEGISAPLANRLQVIKCPAPGSEHLDGLAAQLLIAEYAARGMNAEWATPLNASEREALAHHWRGGSIRNLKRFVGGIIDARDTVDQFGLH